eukprot:1821159-Rhodomonas_salina.3
MSNSTELNWTCAELNWTCASLTWHTGREVYAPGVPGAESRKAFGAGDAARRAHTDQICPNRLHFRNSILKIARNKCKQFRSICSNCREDGALGAD